MDKDVYINLDTGDIEVGRDGDIKAAYGPDVFVENIIFRLRTELGDYLLAPQCGASLRDFFGKDNTKELGDTISQRITNALTYDGFMNNVPFTVDVFPLNAETIAAVITVTYAGASYTVASSLNLRNGQIEIGSK